MKHIVATLLILTALNVQANSTHPLSQAQRFERYDAMFDMQALISGGVVTPNWMADGQRFWYVTAENDSTVIKLVDPAAGTVTPFFNVQRLRVALAGMLEKDLPGSGIPFTDFQLADNETQANFRIDDHNYGLNLSTYELERTPIATPEDSPPQEEALLNPDGTQRLVVRDFNLWLETTDGSSDPVRLTDDGSQEIMWTTYGAHWSADGSQLAVTRYDIGDVLQIPVVDWLDPTYPVHPMHHPVARNYELVGDLYVLQDDKLIKIDAHNEPDDDLVVVDWAPAMDDILVQRINLTTTKQDLLAVNPNTGRIRSLVSERHKTFLAGPACVYQFEDFYTPVGDGEHFIWMSDRDGYMHFYLYTYDGQLVRQITHGDYEDLRILKVDPQTGWIYHLVRSGAEDPYHFHVCRIQLTGDNFMHLTSGLGRHQPVFSPDLSCFVDNYSTSTVPPTSDLRRIDGELVRQLETADITALQAAGWQAPQRVIGKAADGKTDLHAALFLPPNFDPALSYPVIELIYAGPQWTIVPSLFVSREYGETATALSQLGYVAVIIDGRGTPGRGRVFHDHVHRQVGSVEIADHASVLRSLAETRPWMDLDRVGVHGKSWGGYFTLRAMLQASDLYKVGVASSLVADLSTGLAVPTVPYHGRPSENPDGYAAGNCLDQADQLVGRLLLTIGTADLNTAFGQTMSMLSAFTEAGKDVDLLVFPGQNHWLQGASFERWKRALRDYFLEHLAVEARER